MIRAFIAVELPEELREEAAAFGQELKRSGADVKWVEAANLHLTLKFLGDITQEQLSSRTSSLQQACAGLSPFPFSVEGIGAFKTTYPVLWVGVRGRSWRDGQRWMHGSWVPEERPSPHRRSAGSPRKDVPHQTAPAGGVRRTPGPAGGHPCSIHAGPGPPTPLAEILSAASQQGRTMAARE